MNRIQGPIVRPAEFAPENERAVPSTTAFTILGRRKGLVAATAACIALPAILAISTLRPYYIATSTLIIGEHQASFHDLQATVDNPTVDAVAINTQVDILKSDTIALDVTQRLDLVHNPEFEAALDHVPLRARITSWVHAKLGHPDVKTPLTPSQRILAVSQILSQKMKIVNDGRSYIIAVSAKTDDPTLSAALANAFVSDYFDFKRRLKVNAIRQANTLLDDQVAPLRSRLQKAEQAVETFQEQNNMVSLPGDQGSSTPSTVANQQLAQMNGQLITAESDLAQKQAQYDQLASARSSGHTDALPESVDSPLVQQLQGQLAVANARVASLSTTAMEGNPDLIAARAEVARLQSHIASEVGKLGGSIENQMASARARVESIKASMASLQVQVAGESKASVTLRQLEAEATAARVVYQDYLGRLTQTSTQAALQEPDANLISNAPVPLGPAGPPKTQYSAIALIFGLAAGCGAALVVERLRAGIRDIAQLETLPELFGLGIVPWFRGSLRDQYGAKPNWLYIEMVDSIRNIFRFGPEHLRAQVALITSAEPGDGKTSLALSLAANTGRDGRRALVIDCDLRGHSAIRLAGAPPRIGNTPIAALDPDQPDIMANALPGVDILTYRSKSSAASARVELAELGALIERNRSRYDTIIIDTPPLLAFPDAALMSSVADGVILAVKAQRTTPTAIREAMRTLRLYNAHLLGGVITQMQERDLSVTDGGVYRFRNEARA